MQNNQKYSAPAIHVRDASLRFGQQVIFSNLNISLKAGKCTAILGPSGIGKSTLLRMIANLIPDSDTYIHTDDHLNLNKRIAYMAQRDLLLPWLNVLDNCLIGHKLRGRLSKKDYLTQKILAKDLLKQVGLSSAETKYPANLSGGMRQRVALVRTLLEDRPVVLMDEPFAALDVITKLRLQNLSANLLKNKTVLLVTHDPLEALRLADEIYVMENKPATLTKAPCPTSLPPRDCDDPELLKLEGALLKQLSAASEGSELC